MKTFSQFISENLLPKQIKEHQLVHRLAGTKHEYWALKLILNGEVVNVYTSKSLPYIRSLMVGWG
jgi:hypothetical protein